MVQRFNKLDGREFNGLKVNNAIKLHPSDNVVVALNSLEVGEHILIDEIGLVQEVKDKIPYGHKVCIQEIKKGEKILKYGECMGIATNDIKVGHHVHVHNVRGLKESERLVSVVDFA